MENVELSEQEVKEQQIADERSEQELRTEKQKSRRIFADIVSRQEPLDFADQPPVKESTTDEPTSKTDAHTPSAPKEQEKPTTAKKSKVDPADDKTKADDVDDESLAQKGGEDDDKAEEPVSESEPLLPEAVSKRLAEEFPDHKIETPEQRDELIGKLISDSKNLEAERKSVEKVYDLFENSDELVNIAREMNQGKGFLEALAKTVNIEETLADLKEADPEQYKKVVRAQIEREKAMEEQEAKQQALEEQFAKNESISQNNIKKFEQSNELTPEASKEFLGTIDQHFQDLVNGKVTLEFMEAVHKGLNYDTAVEAAKEQGRIEGRNEKINAEKAKKQGDNLPRIPKGQSTSKATDEPQVTRGKRALAKLAADSQSQF